MKRVVRNNPWALLTALVLFVASPLALMAQVKTTTTTEHGTPSVSTKVETGEVVYVGASDLIVKTPDGELHHLTNIPPDRTAMVDGKAITIKDVKPGMKLSRITTITTTPRMVRTVKTVTGTVWNVTPPNRVILTLEDGTNQSFNIPKGQKFMVNGQETDAFGLRKGMKVSGTAITESPETVVAQEVARTGKRPPPPPPPPADQPVLVMVTPAPAAPAAAPEEAPKALPKTASQLPLVGLLGLLLMGASLGLRSYRRAS